MYSISDLQRLSGVRAHTIRAWEHRYKALKPLRSDGNTRYYNERHLRRLLNIASLADGGIKISKLCRLPDAKINELVYEKMNQTVADNSTEEYFISQIVAAAMEFDETKFDKLFSHASARHGIKNVYSLIIYPALVRIGLMWTTNLLPPLQEHFITNLIRQKLYVAIDSIIPSKKSTQTWLLFLPEGEFHETGLLLANYLIRQSGQKVIYLGSNVPIDSVELSFKNFNPTHLLFFMVSKNDDTDDEKLLTKLKSKFSKQRIFMASDKSRLTKIRDTKNFMRLYSVNELEKILK